MQLIKQDDLTSNKRILKTLARYPEHFDLLEVHRRQIRLFASYMGLSPVAPRRFLCWRLEALLRRLRADDALILKEGIESLAPDELREALEERGMYGNRFVIWCLMLTSYTRQAQNIPVVESRKYLQEWIDLNVHDSPRVPTALILFSRPFVFSHQQRRSLHPTQP